MIGLPEGIGQEIAALVPEFGELRAPRHGWQGL